MSRLQFTITVCSVLFIYLIVAFWKRPVTNSGKLALKLSLINLTSWVLVLPFGSHGHPPPQLIVGFLLWLLNLPLLIAMTMAVWMTFKSREENIVFVVTSASYLTLNVVMLWIVPAIGLYLIS